MRGPRKEPRYKVTMCPQCGSRLCSTHPDHLRGLRLASGLTIAQTARWMRVSMRYIIDVEHGARECPEWMYEYYEEMGRTDLGSIVNEELDLIGKRR